MRRRRQVGWWIGLFLLAFGWNAGAQSDLDSVRREIEFEARRLDAGNPMTRARATDLLRHHARDPRTHPWIRPHLPKLRELLNDPVEVVRWNAAVALLRVGGDAEAEAAFEVLSQDAKRPEYDVRIGVVETLAELREWPQARSLLQELSRSDPDDQVREAARLVLQQGQRRGPERVDWSELLSRSEPEARLEALEELLRATEAPWAREPYRSVVPALRPLLKEEDSRLRQRAAVLLVRLLGAEEGQEALELLQQEVESPDPEVRRLLVQSAEELDPELGEPILERLAEDADPEVRAEAEAVLQARRMRQRAFEARDQNGGPPPMPPEGLPWTRQGEEPPDPAQLLREAQDALERLPALDALERLAELARNREGFVVGEEVTTWPALLAPHVGRLLEWLREGSADPMACRYAAHLLGIAGEEAVVALVAALEDPDPQVRRTAAFALMWSLADAEGNPLSPPWARLAGDALSFSLQDDDPPVRSYAALGIGLAGARRYHADLRSLAQSDPDERVRIAAVRGWLLLEPGSGAVRELLQRWAAQQGEGGWGAQQLLARLGDPEAQAVLWRALQEGEPRRVYEAAGALATVLHPEDRVRLEALRGSDRPEVREAATRLLRHLGMEPAPRRRAFRLRPIGEEPEPSVGRVELGPGWYYFSPYPIAIPLPDAQIAYTGPENGAVKVDSLGSFRLETLPLAVYNGRLEAPGTLPQSWTGAPSAALRLWQMHRDY
ncbi:MAG: hypothetical protein KatS3mg115_1313 [Candidatus Poribacteria bacterium]|nr:MAG: hypothetical protein KatS3mg115_1313 [Candidatus Poribacteria bacterium]